MFDLLPADFFHYLSDYLSLLEIINLSRISIDLDKYLSKDQSFWQSKCNSKKKSEEQTWKQFYVANYMTVYTFGCNVDSQLSGFKIKDIAISKHIIGIDLHDNVWAYCTNTSPHMGFDKEYFKVPRKLDHKAKYVATDGNHIGFIDMENNAWVHGTNEEGELGVGFSTHLVGYQYVQIPPLISSQGYKTKVQQICFGYSYTMLLDTENNIWGSGTNEYGQLGLGNWHSQTRFTQIKGLKAKQIAVGSGEQSSHTVIIDLEDNIWGFGRSGFGQLGQKDNDFGHPKPIQIIPSNGFNGKAKQIAAGYVHTLIIDLEDNVWTIGSNSSGQLGFENYNRRFSYHKPQKIGIKAKQIIGCNDHSILIDLEDNVWVFGSNFHGQLGIKDLGCSFIPVQIPNIKAFKIAVGNDSSAIITRI